MDLVMKASLRSRRLALFGALIGVVALAAACDPGWTSAALGTGDGSGTVPGATSVADAQVALSQPTATLDLGSRGFLTYDRSTCQIFLSHDGQTSLFAGNGVCGYTGDGGPAPAAQIQLEEPPFGSGMQLESDGTVLLDVYDAVNGNGAIRRIELTGTITTVPTVSCDGDLILGMAPGENGSVAYLCYFSVDADDGYERGYEVHTVDPDGTDHLVSRTSDGISEPPTGFVRVGADHWVALGGKDSDSAGQVLVDFDNGTVTTTDLTNASVVASSDLILLDSADSAGNLYGVSMHDTYDSHEFDGNRVVRIAPDGSVAVIAGSGTADPGTSQQLGTAANLNLTATSVSVTQAGNLLISSGHVIYRMLDAAHAPVIESSSP